MSTEQNARNLEYVRSLLSKEYPYLLKIKDHISCKTKYCVAKSLNNRAKAKPNNSGNTFNVAISHWDVIEQHPTFKVNPENSGGSCDYYKCFIENPTTAEDTYTAECNDVIEALDMTYAEANIFKEIWRSAAARTLGKVKEGHTAQRGAEKIVFFAKRNAVQKGVIG